MVVSEPEYAKAPAARITVEEAQRAGREILNGRVDTPALDADLILAGLLECERARLFARTEDVVPERIWSEFLASLSRRLSGVPVSYLTGWKQWYGLRLAVSPAVLIPRPETEMLVDLAVGHASSLLEPVVADVGTGSGAIAIALARALPNVEIVATDISAEALEVAGQNVAAYGLQERVRLVLGDLVEPLNSSPSLIIANLPYLPISDQDLVHPDVLSEPYRALFSEEDGTAVYRRLLEQLTARSWAPMILMEIDPRQAGQIQQLAGRFYPRAPIRVLQDLAGLDRYITVEPSA